MAVLYDSVAFLAGNFAHGASVNVRRCFKVTSEFGPLKPFAGVFILSVNAKVNVSDARLALRSLIALEQRPPEIVRPACMKKKRRKIHAESRFGSFQNSLGLYALFSIFSLYC